LYQNFSQEKMAMGNGKLRMRIFFRGIFDDFVEKF
jgi:hypothetical protein